jgi:16S rRNA (uracil1498-N3)-methyltransferase
VSLVPFVHIDTPLATGSTGDHVELDARDLHHLTTVLRLHPGAELELADGQGGWAAARLTEDGATLREPAVHVPRPRPELVVAQGLPKARKLDDIVRVCTELGVDALLPVAANRSVTRLSGPKADKAVERWTAVARAASEQARRVYRPDVGAIRPAAAVGGEAGASLVVAHPGGGPLPRLFDELATADRVVLAIGPEGGWSDAEVGAWEDEGARVAGLGPTVLRTEHAAAAALAALGAGLGRWDDDGRGTRPYGDTP